jgi:arylsulfatase A-like enzyme
MKTSNASSRNVSSLMRRGVVLSILTVMLWAGLLTSPGLAETTPNIVLLFVDDLGSYHVGYNNDRFDTLHIDALKTEGMFFSDAYSASPTCSPSRSSVVTGRHPARLRIVRHVPGGDKFGRTDIEFNTHPNDPSAMPSRNWLPLEETTLGEAVKPLGYYSCFVGKWHLGHEPYHPINNGFDEQHGVTNFGHPGSYHAPFWKDKTTTYKDVPEGKYLTDQLTDDAVAFLGRADQDVPFLLTLFYYGVHTPHQGREDLVAKYEARGLVGREAHHAAMVEAVDESIGRIRRELNEQGLADDTVLIFFSDQGGWMPNDPLRGSKAGGTALYDGGARVPLIVTWPGVVKPGSLCDEPVLSTDILPTIVETAGGDSEDCGTLDGLSLMPLLTQRGELDRDAIFMYRSYESQYASVRSDEWKMVAYRDGSRELYDLDADPREESDVAADHEDVIRNLNEKLHEFEVETNVTEFNRIVQ